MELVDVRSAEIAFEHKRAVFGDQEAVDAVDQANERCSITVKCVQIVNLDSVVAIP